MREIIPEYIQQNMLDAHFEIDDYNGNWYGVTKYYDKFRIVRNGVELCKVRSLDRVAKVLNKEISQY